MAFRDITYNTGAGLASLNLTVPDDTQEGDTLLLFMLVNGVQTITTPSGYTLIGVKHDTASLSAAAFWKVADADDIGGAVAVTTSAGSGGKTAGALAAYSGTDATAPIHVTAYQAATGTPSAHPISPVTTTADNCQIVTAVVAKETGGTSWTPPSGYTLRGTPPFPGTGGQCTSAVADDPTLRAAGSYGSGNWVENVTSANCVTWTVALAPLTTTTTARPVADVTTTGWTGHPTPGAGVSLASLLADNSASTYVESEAAADGQVLEVKLGSMTGAPYQLEVTVQDAGGAVSRSLLTELVQGDTVVADWPAEEVVVTSATTYTYTLTSDQRAACTDLSDLRLRWTATVA